MTDWNRDRLGDAATVVSKSGSLSRGRQLRKLDPLAEVLDAAWDGELLYDIFYDGDRLDSLSYTEILSQGLMVKPCNNDVRYRAARLALEDDDAPIDGDQLLAGVSDKYRLTRYRGERLAHVVLLPGGNIAEQVIDWDKVKAAVAGGAWVKPHPITRQDYLEHIQGVIGAERVLPSRLGGHGLAMQADKLSVSTTSELGLVGILSGKDVELIDRGGNLRPAYKHLYDAVMDQPDRKAALEKVLGSRRGGVLWHWQGQERAQQIVDAIREVFDA